jgi:hypothetical protein
MKLGCTSVARNVAFLTLVWYIETSFKRSVYSRKSLLSSRTSRLRGSRYTTCTTSPARPPPGLQENIWNGDRTPLLRAKMYLYVQKNNTRIITMKKHEGQKQQQKRNFAMVQIPPCRDSHPLARIHEDLAASCLNLSS